MKLSIIIPIYNVEAYLPACLDSVFAQGLDEDAFEVLCVNDGTPDDSVQIIKNYMALHKNIVLVEQENQGVSVARNNGLSRAKGDYVLFLDSDDKLSDNSLCSIYKKLEANDGADAVICNFRRNGSYFYCWHNLFAEAKDYNGEQILNGGLLYGSVMGVCFNRAFLESNNIRFLTGVRNGEDTCFMLQCMFHATKVRFLNADLYNVVSRPDSASHSFTKERIDCMIESVKVVYDFRKRLMGCSGNRMVLDYMIYTMLVNLVKDTLLTPGLGYTYLCKAGIKKYCKFHISPATYYLRSKMLLLSSSFFLFYFIRRVSTLLR